MLLRNNNITECFLTCKVKVKVAQLCPTFCNSSWNSPGQNARVDSCSLLQGIFPMRGLNLGLPHFRQILYQLSHQGSNKNTGVGSHFLLQGIFLTQGSNPGLLHCRQTLSCLSYHIPNMDCIPGNSE